MNKNKPSLKIDIEWPEIPDNLEAVQSEVQEVYKELLDGDVPGSDFLGWRDWPLADHSELIAKINELAAEIQQDADYFISAGIGGSYLGARAVIEALTPHRELRGIKPQIIWAGHNISGYYHSAVLEKIKDSSVYANIISKSGTTTETALSFRLLREQLKEEYSRNELSKRIIATTSKDSGALIEAARENGYRCFEIPDNVGGRFSVFTAVGLLPAAVAGVDIQRLLEGAGAMAKKLCSGPEDALEAIHYAAARNAFDRNGGRIEILASFYPEISSLGKWWQQLFGESEGKENRGLYPGSVDFSTDLHSLGQYIQEGPRDLMETFIKLGSESETVDVPAGESSSDGLDYLTGRSLSEINEQAFQGTRSAHIEGGIPVVTLNICKLDPWHLGALLYFFQFSCALSALTLGVNPFNQPGVEAYKTNMYRRLGKPGF